MTTVARSGQAVAAVARRLERGVRQHTGHDVRGVASVRSTLAVFEALRSRAPTWGWHT